MPRTPKTPPKARENPPRAAKTLATKIIRGEAVPRDTIRRIRKRQTPKDEEDKSPRKASQSYLSMAKNAIEANPSKNGTSFLTIVKYVEGNFTIGKIIDPSFVVLFLKQCKIKF